MAPTGGATEVLPHTVPLPVIDLHATVPASASPHSPAGVAAAAPQPLRSRSQGRRSTGPTPIRVGARRRCSRAHPARGQDRPAHGPACCASRDTRAATASRASASSAGLAVVASLVLGSAATVTAAVTGQPLLRCDGAARRRGQRSGRARAHREPERAAARAAPSRFPRRRSRLPPPHSSCAPCRRSRARSPRATMPRRSPPPAAPTPSAPRSPAEQRRASRSTTPRASGWCSTRRARSLRSTTGRRCARDAGRRAQRRGRVAALGCRRRPHRDGRRRGGSRRRRDRAR